MVLPTAKPAGSVAEPAVATGLRTGDGDVATASVGLEVAAPARGPNGMDAYLDGVAAGIIIGDHDGKLVYWNPAALALHGFATLDDVRLHLSAFRSRFVLGYADGRVVPFEQWPMARLLRGEAVTASELSVTRIDTGQRRVIRYTGTTVRQGGGDALPGRFILTLDDITAQRQAERDLRQSQDYFRELIECLPQLVWTCRAVDSSFDYVSPQFAGYAGLPASDLVGRGWPDRVHQDDRGRFDEAWRAASSGGVPLDVEARLRRGDGAYRWFKTRAVPLRDAGGNVERWIGTSTDVHDERTAAEATAVLAAIVEHSDDAIVGKRLDGTMTSWNRAAERVFGYPAAEAVGRNVSILLPPDRVEEERAIIRRLTDGQLVDHFESQRVTKDGRLIDVALTISPIRDTAGRVVGASKIARDVTAANRDARALRDSEARFRHLAAAVPQIVWTSDPAGRTTYLNDRWTQYTGLVSADVEDLLRVVHPADAEAVARAGRDARAAGRAYEVEFRLRPAGRDDEDYRWFLARAVPIRDAGGAIVEWFGTSTDIHDLKRAEAVALDNEARLRGVLDGLLVFVAILKPDGRLSGMNRAARDALASRGARAEDVESRVFFDLPIPGMIDDVRSALRSAVAEASVGREVRLDGVRVAAGQTDLVLDLMLAPMAGGGGDVIVSAVDVTAREQADRRARDRQAELAHLERLRTMGQMAAGLAHELNQPLGAISNYAGACRRLSAAGRLPPGRLEEALSDVQAEAARAGAIIGRLRGFVKKQEPRTAAVDLNAVVEDAVRLLAYDLRKAGLEPKLSLDPALPPAKADAVQVGQVLVNLIRNALDAMEGVDPRHRSLELRTSASPDRTSLAVAVRDAGCGIPPADVGRVFDAFFTTKSGGLGVGLALCRTIAEDHGGHLAAEPNADGGTTFVFTLRPA